MPEPPAVNLYYIVLNGVDENRVGRAIDTLTMEELFGGWREWLRAALTLRPRRRWRATWIVLEFPEGDQGSYRLSELEQRHGG